MKVTSLIGLVVSGLPSRADVYCHLFIADDDSNPATLTHLQLFPYYAVCCCKLAAYKRSLRHSAVRCYCAGLPVKSNGGVFISNLLPCLVYAAVAHCAPDMA